MSSIIIPAWPQYSDYRELKPPADPAALSDLCSRILEQHGSAVDQLHSDVRKMLAVGHSPGRKWACNEVRTFLATIGRQQLLDNYFEKLETAKEAAKALPFIEFMTEQTQQALEIQVEPDMPHELRIQLRVALVEAQSWENQSQAENAKPSGRRVRKPGSAAKRHRELARA